MTAFTIRDVRARRLDIAMRKAFGIAGGAQERACNVLVEVTLVSGVRGWGEAAPLPPFNGETQDEALAAVARATPSLLGADVRAWRAVAEKIQDVAAPSASAACALETAAVDALARARDTSLRVFFGGAEEQLVTDITITTGTVDEAAREAIELAGAFATLKIKVGGRADHDVDLDVARVVAVHAARPSGPPVSAPTASAWSPHRTTRQPASGTPKPACPWAKR